MAQVPAKKLINKPDDVVVEMLEGLCQTNPSLVHLDGFPDIKVILRRDLDKSKVALISGGGSGHEPAHAGYVGEGMLSAAVCGSVFASPSVDAVLAAIRAVTGPPGCLLIVKNYTGDRLNFGLAAERAKVEGFDVAMVVVGEDCALPSKGIAGRRGLAGTVLVHKVAGAAAAAGLPLADVRAEAAAAGGLMGTMGVALSVCTLPGCAPPTRLQEGYMELGLGIHGEPGADTAPIAPCDAVVQRILEQIVSPANGYLTLSPGDRVALMVNNLGGTPLMEVLVAARAAGAWLRARGVQVAHAYTGGFMTALEMQGLSITVAKVDGLRSARLLAPTRAPAWPSAAAPPGQLPTAVPMPPGEGSTGLGEVAPPPATGVGKALGAGIAAAAAAVRAAEPQLTEWDRIVGDGDCGATFAKAGAALLEDLPHYTLDDPAATASQMGHTVQRSMGGTSGALYAIFFNAAAASLTRQGPAAGPAGAPGCLIDAFAAGVGAMQEYGGAARGYATMLDALIPAVQCLETMQRTGSASSDPLASFEAAVGAARAGAESTKDMAALAGRASYVPEAQQMNTPDPGAMAAATWLEAVLSSLRS